MSIRRYASAIILMFLSTATLMTGVAQATTSTTLPAATNSQGFSTIADELCLTVSAEQVSEIEGAPSEGSFSGVTTSELADWATFLSRDRGLYEKGQIALRALSSLAGGESAAVWSKGDVVVNDLQAAQQAAANKSLVGFRAAMAKIQPDARAAAAAAKAQQIACYLQVNL
jgi:hypothetical protein